MTPRLGRFCVIPGLLWAIAAASPAAEPAATRMPAPGTPTGRITEWNVPTNQTTRDPVVDSKGNVYFAVSRGDRIARFDPAERRFTEWKVPEGTRPHGMAIGADDKVYFGGRGNGTIGVFDPATGGIRIHKVTEPTGEVYSLTTDAEGSIWFTARTARRIGKLDRSSGAVTTFAMGGDPYSLVQDKSGRIWVTLIGEGRLAILDPRTGSISEISTGVGTRPRRIAVAPDGAIWVTLYGVGKVIRVDPVTRSVVRQYDLPGGATAGPYSVAVGRDGRVWVSEFQTDAIAALDPASGEFRVFNLPRKMSGVRNAVIDAYGRYWYVATTAGKLGLID